MMSTGSTAALIAGIETDGIAGDVGGAIGSFRRYTDAFPEDPSGWEGVLAAARRCDDPAGRP